MMYRHKPQTVDAVLYDPEKALPRWAQAAVVTEYHGATMASVTISTRHGMITAWEGQDYILRFPDDSIDIMKKDIFEREFEIAEE